MATSDPLLLQKRQELTRTADLRQPSGNVALLRELRDLAENREVLVGDLERWGDDQEEVVDRLVVDGAEVDSSGLRPNATRSLLTTSERQCGIAIPGRCPSIRGSPAV
jgi:hypothetical protein